MAEKFPSFVIFMFAFYNFFIFVKTGFIDKTYKKIENKLKKIMYFPLLILGMLLTIMVMYYEIIDLLK